MKYAVEEKKERLSQLNYKLVMTICKISLVISKPPRHAASFLQSERPYLIQKRGEFSISEIMKILVGRGGGGGGGQYSFTLDILIFCSISYRLPKKWGLTPLQFNFIYVNMCKCLLQEKVGIKGATLPSPHLSYVPATLLINLNAV